MVYITYRILDNGTAVLLTRQPTTTNQDITLIFSDAPDNATAIIECGEDSSYFKLVDGRCTVPILHLNGTVKVTVAVLDDSVSLNKWICDELKVDRLWDGHVLVCPNDLNLPQVIADLRIDNQFLRIENREIKDDLDKLNKRLDKMMDAYDFI